MYYDYLAAVVHSVRFIEQVTGCVTDGAGVARWLIRGTWDGQVDIAPITAIEGAPENPTYKTGEFETVWRKNEPPYVLSLSIATKQLHTGNPRIIHAFYVPKIMHTFY